LIVIERTKLKFLLSGRALVIDVPAPERYRTGRSYALGFNHRRTVCRVEIIEVLDETIRVRLADMDPPLLLAARSQYGYTDDPAKAMRDEPEAVHPGELKGINRRRAEIADFQASVLAQVDMLASGATAAENRRLRNLRRIASSL
jgi:hypothetical protein